MRTLSKEELYKIYPSSDGKPMADNTLQWEWIALIKQGMDAVFKNRKDVFVAGDLFWYPVEGRSDLRVAPDVLIAIGVPKGTRGSYLQWIEDNIPPQVVVEILSPSNRAKEMAEKLEFYQTYGVKEYYIYDPIKLVFSVYERHNDILVLQTLGEEWVSPILRVRWKMNKGILEIYGPDGKPFLSYLEVIEEQIAAIEELERQRIELNQNVIMLLEQEKMMFAQIRTIEQERKKVKEEKQRADEEKAAKEKLIQKLKELGIDPESI